MIQNKKISLFSSCIFIINFQYHEIPIEFMQNSLNSWDLKCKNDTKKIKIKNLYK